MQIQENCYNTAVRDNKVVLGISLDDFATRGIAKYLENAGLDWVAIDMEHSGYTLDTIANLVAWFEATPLTVIVRLPAHNPTDVISAVLDVGAMGIMCPHIDDAEDARRMVKAAMYPPLGERGVGTNAAHTKFRKVDIGAYLKARNEQTTITAMIESKAGLDNVDAIAAVEGIHSIHPSHEDLSTALGVPGQYTHPTYRAALTKIVEACKRHGKAIKFNPFNEESAAEFYNYGCRILGVRAANVAMQEAITGDVTRMHARLAQIAK